MVRKCTLCKGVGHNRTTCQSRSHPTIMYAQTPPRNSQYQALSHTRTPAENTTQIMLGSPTQFSSIPPSFNPSRYEVSPSTRFSALANVVVPNSVSQSNNQAEVSGVPEIDIDHNSNGSLIASTVSAVSDFNHEAVSSVSAVSTVSNVNCENSFGNQFYHDGSPALNSPWPPLPNCFPTNMPAHFSIAEVTLASESSFRWGQQTRENVIANVCLVYEEITKFRKNIFDLPKTSTGNKFVGELTRLFKSAMPGNALQIIALKALAILPHLVLQKATPQDRAKENKINLDRRLALWFSGEFLLLLEEASIIQGRLISSKNGMRPEVLNRKVNERVMLGDMKGALKLVENQSQRGGILPLNADVVSRLKELHPEAIPPSDEVLSRGPPPNVLSVVFEPINGQLIRSCAIRSSGSCGVSGGDAAMWKQFLCSHGMHSDMLCEAMALHARSLCQEIHDPRSLEAFLANRLVPLDKNPGVRPVGIGEMPRRIYGKAFSVVFKNDIIAATGATQLCCGQEAGIEAIIHAMTDLFADDDCEGLLLIDADNAFNRVNRYAVLHNAQYSCPAIAKVLNNFYRNSVRLFVSGGAEILSQEGTTQGCPLAMQMYALALMPLIDLCRQLVPVPGEPPDPTNAFTQAWYADDAQAAGSLLRLREFLKFLLDCGPAVGYFVKVSKTVLIVKESLQDYAKEIFQGLDICIQTRGARDLGSAIGSREFVTTYVKKKAEHWASMIDTLTDLAKAHPQSAYSLFVHAMRHKLSFIERTTADVGACLQIVEDSIKDNFIPAIFGSNVTPTDLEREIYSLPINLGGLSIDNPVTGAAFKHAESRSICRTLSHLIKHSVRSYAIDVAAQNTLKSDIKKARKVRLVAQAAKIKEKLDSSMQRCMDIAQERGASVVFTLVPVAKFGYGLHNKREFTDAVCVRYNRALPNFPLLCACGQPNSINHALNCVKGGFVHQRHDQVRDLLANFCSEVVRDVEIEPKLASLNGEVLQTGANTADEARSD